MIPYESVFAPEPPHHHPGPPHHHPGGGRGPRSKDGRILIASPDGRDGSLQINQDAEIWLWRLGEGLSPEALAKGEEQATIEVPEGKGAWVQVVGGEVETVGISLRSSDAFGVDDSAKIRSISAAELLVFVI